MQWREPSLDDNDGIPHVVPNQAVLPSPLATQEAAPSSGVEGSEPASARGPGVRGKRKSRGDRSSSASGVAETFAADKHR